MISLRSFLYYIYKHCTSKIKAAASTSVTVVETDGLIHVENKTIFRLRRENLRYPKMKIKSQLLHECVINLFTFKIYCNCDLIFMIMVISVENWFLSMQLYYTQIFSSVWMHEAVTCDRNLGWGIKYEYEIHLFRKCRPLTQCPS